MIGFNGPFAGCEVGRSVSLPASEATARSKAIPRGVMRPLLDSGILQPEGINARLPRYRNGFLIPLASRK